MPEIFPSDFMARNSSDSFQAVPQQLRNILPFIPRRAIYDFCSLANQILTRPAAHPPPLSFSAFLSLTI